MSASWRRWGATRRHPNAKDALGRTALSLAAFNGWARPGRAAPRPPRHRPEPRRPRSPDRPPLGGARAATPTSSSDCSAMRAPTPGSRTAPPANTAQRRRRGRAGGRPAGGADAHRPRHRRAVARGRAPRAARGGAGLLHQARSSPSRRTWGSRSRCPPRRPRSTPSRPRRRSPPRIRRRRPPPSARWCWDSSAPRATAPC